MRKTKPSIRFAEFTDDWVQRELNQVAPVTMGTSPKSENYTENPDDHILVQGNADMNNGFVSPRVWTTQVTKTAEAGNLILSVRAPVGEVGKTAYDVVLGRGVAGIKGNEFIFQSLKQVQSKGYWARMSSGSTFDSVTSEQVKTLPIMVPDEAEQELIGKFLCQLDDLIAANQRQLDLLKKQKKGFLQKMFPKQGAKVPELRFAEFTDDWVQRKFSDFYKKNLERNKGQFAADRTISIATMRFREEGNGASEDSLASYKVLREGDIAFEGHTSKRFAFGRFVLNDIGDGIMSPRFTTLRPIKDMPVTFWKQYIHYEPIMRYPIVHSTKLGTMMNELVVDEFLNQPVLVPSDAEQNQIGQVLTLVDNLIDANQRQLDLLKEQKKGFLQKMFV